MKKNKWEGSKKDEYKDKNKIGGHGKEGSKSDKKADKRDAGMMLKKAMKKLSK